MDKTEAPGATIRVWDLFVRLGHWVLAIGFLVAWLTAEEWEGVHVWSGYLIGGVIALRIVWGFTGPRYARFSEFVRSPRAVFKYLRGLGTGTATRYLGHNPAGGAMAIALLVTLTATIVTGVMLYAIEDNAGPLAPYVNTTPTPANVSINRDEGHERDAHEEEHDSREERWEELHEVAATVTLWLVGLHILGVLVSSLTHRENLPLAMITGRKRAE